MKIIYLLKKGFQFFPPCLSQVLYLNDLGVDIEVYHGENSPFINQLLDKRQIKHHLFLKDRKSRNKLDQIFNFYSFSKEIKYIQKKLPEDSILWIGNLETAMTMDFQQLKKRKFILNVLELYDTRTIYDRFLKKVTLYANVLICCEKHRAAIMQSRYSLKESPIIMPNKPYDLEEQASFDALISEKISNFKNQFIVLYQGIVTPDRPLVEVASALREIQDNNIAFAFMGRCNDKNYPIYLKSIYPQTYYLGYIPAPQHLAVTAQCHLGIANYDFSSLNNVFCAPNKIYEYAKFGKPILASQNLGLTETVGAADAAECVDFKNVDEVATAILKIRDNYERYSKAAVDFYNATDYKALVQQVIDKL